MSSPDLPADPSGQTPEERSGEDDRFAAFRHASFVRYWLANFFARFSVNVVSVAVGWQVYAITENPFDLGLIGLVEFAPALLLVLVTGAVADRFGRRLIMGTSALGEAVCGAILVYFAFIGLETVLPIFVVLAFFGIARAFAAPASAALLANVVPAKDFANAVAWNSSAWQTASIVGPAAGGLLYGVSPEFVYSVAVILLLASAILAFAIPRPNQHEQTERVTLNTLLGGFSYVWREKVVMGAISLDLFVVLLGGVVALLPVFASDDILDIGSTGLGLLRAAPGVGAMAMALWLSGGKIRDHAGIIMLVCVAIFGLANLVFGLSTVAWLSIAMMGVAGAADMVSVFIRETLIQLWTPDRLRGRVNAINMVFVGASNELGMFRAGTMAGFLGAVPAVVIGGVGAVGVAGLWAWLFPELRKARHLDGRT